jgi:hypothetical protein
MALAMACNISGLAFVLGALAAEQWSPDGKSDSALWIIAGAFLLLGGVLLLGVFSTGQIGSPEDRLTDVPEPGVTPEAAVAAISYEVADKALTAQLDQWRDLRGRVATLATIGPAAAAVVVATSGDKFDLLALLAILLLAAAIVQSTMALWRAGIQTRFKEGPSIEGLPAGTDAASLHAALAGITNATREANVLEVKRVEELFLRAVAAFLLAVLFWSVHAAIGSDVLFSLG